AKSRQASYAAQQQMELLLRDRHHIRQGQDDDFSVRNLADLADLASEASKVMTALLASIAGVSLLVGGIGIMNIMLVSVTERTREIGVRIAIGATEGDVPRQFLIEAVVMSLIGKRIRSLVTMLGISMGVGSFICVVAVGNAGASRVEEQLSNVGDNLIWVEAGSRARSGVRIGSRGTKTLMIGDVQAVLDQVP